MNECGFSRSSVGTDLSNKNKFLILVINIVLWIFTPIKFIVFLLCLLIRFAINIYSVRKFLFSTCSNVPGCCETNEYDIDARVDDRTKFRHM